MMDENYEESGEEFDPEFLKRYRPCPHCGEVMNVHPVDRALGSELVSCKNNCHGKRYEVKEMEQ